MVRVHQAASVIVIAFSLWVIRQALSLNYYTPLGPGPGFFPFWLAVLLGGLSAVWFVQLWLKPVPGKAVEFVPSRAGILRISALVLSVAIVGLFMDTIGFSITMFVFMMFLLVGLGRVNLVVTMVLALTCSFGLYWVFTTYLDVQLPASSIGLLRELGF